MTGADPGAWGNAEELLALIAELVDGGNRLFIQAHTKKGTPAPKPLEIKRPTSLVDDDDEPTPRKRQATSEELRAFFGAGGSVRYTGPRAVEQLGETDAGNRGPR